MFRIHPGGGNLHRVENIEARIDEEVEKFHDRTAAVFEGLPRRVLVNPVIDALVAREPQILERLRGTKGGLLRSKIRAANIGDVDGSGASSMHPAEIFENHLRLAPEHLADIVRPAFNRHVPFGDVANPFGLSLIHI